MKGTIIIGTASLAVLTALGIRIYIKSKKKKENTETEDWTEFVNDFETDNQTEEK